MLHTAQPELIEQIAWLLPRLPAPAPFTIRGEVDYYGASHEIASALGLDSPPPTSATWRHGWSRFPSRFPEMAATYKPGPRVHLMPDAHHERLLLDAGYPNALAVGYPLLYTTPSGHPRQPRSLLAAPFHLLPEVEPSPEQTRFEHDFAAYLASQRAHFDTVCACLHVNCIDTGLWTRTLEAHGIPWVLGAMTHDARSLRRVRTLFESFDCVVTNHIGSVMPYAAHLGARVCVAGPPAPLPSAEAFARHPTYQKHPEALDRLKVTIDLPLHDDLPFLLREPAEATRPADWAAAQLGAPHQVNHDAIARLLGWRVGPLPTPPDPEHRRRLLLSLGWSPPALGHADARFDLARLLEKNDLAAPGSNLESALQELKDLRRQRKALQKQANTGTAFDAFRRSLTWRLLAKPLHSLEKRLRPSLRK